MEPRSIPDGSPMSRKSRVRRKSSASRAAKTGRPGQKARSSTRPDPAAPVNRKGVLAGHEPEIVRLYAEGKGRRISSIARTFGVSHNAIKKCLALPRRAANKNSHFGKRFSKCCACWAPIPVSGSATRGFCSSCSQRACDTITVYDRDKGIGEVPETLRRRYSLSG